MKLKNIIIGALILLCAAGGAFALLKVHGPSGSGDESADENVPSIISVQVGALTNVTLHGYVSGYGTIEAAPATPAQPASGATLAAPTAGIVAKINAVAGQRVRKGDILIELNSSTTTYSYAKAELARQKQLLAGQNTSLKNVEDATAQLASLQIVAPVSGTVTAVNVRPGQAVDATTTVADIVDLNRLAISVRIPVAQAKQLRAGQQIEITDGKPIVAALSFVGSTVDPADGTVMAWALLPSKAGLLPGQFVPFRIVTATQTNCLAAPAESVVTDEQGEASIWTVTNNEAIQTPVQTGLRNNEWVEISASGLKSGDEVVTVGAYGLPDKTQIKILNSSSDKTNSPEGQ